MEKGKRGNRLTVNKHEKSEGIGVRGTETSRSPHHHKVQFFSGTSPRKFETENSIEKNGERERHNEEGRLVQRRGYTGCWLSKVDGRRLGG